MTAPISNGPTTTRLHHYAGHYSVAALTVVTSCMGSRCLLALVTLSWSLRACLPPGLLAAGPACPRACLPPGLLAAGPSMNVARNSLAAISNIEFPALELQRFEA